jgi:hypothetical protein
VKVSIVKLLYTFIQSIQTLDFACHLFVALKQKKHTSPNRTDSEDYFSREAYANEQCTDGHGETKNLKWARTNIGPQIAYSRSVDKTMELMN